MATYAIGDIQGCYTELNLLLNVIKFNEQTDTLWIAGDLINRGPDSLAVLKRLYTLRDSSKIVLGNHDLHFLAVAAGTRKISKKDTFQDALNDPMLPQLVEWLRQLPLIIHCPKRNLSMMHAGIPPIWSLEQALELSTEVEACLQSDHWQGFTQQMYGNTPQQWDDALKGYDRLRLITNYLTRMRFCDNRGRLDLEDKANTHSNQKGFDAWFRHPNKRLPQNHEIVFGHWAALEGATDSNKHHALDTGCVWGGELTAMDLDTKQRYTHTMRAELQSL